MLTPDMAYTRTLTLVLQESEWRALRDIEPDAVGWLQSQIRSRLGAETAAPEPHASPYASQDDEY